MVGNGDGSAGSGHGYGSPAITMASSNSPPGQGPEDRMEGCEGTATTRQKEKKER
jgi:hypothetical protein